MVYNVTSVIIILTDLADLMSRRKSAEGRHNLAMDSDQYFK